MLNHFLVCVVVYHDRLPHVQLRVYPIRSDYCIEDLTYPNNTVFFYVTKAGSKTDIINQADMISFLNPDTLDERAGFHTNIQQGERIFFIGQKLVVNNQIYVYNKNLTCRIPIPSVPDLDITIIEP